MWPFSLFTKAQERRTYLDAQCIFAAAYTFEKLPPDRRAEVEAAASRLIRPYLSYPEFRACVRWSFRAAVRAVAMDALGIAPLGLARWPLRRLYWGSALARVPKTPLQETYRWTDPRAGMLALRFRPMADATIRARDEMRRMFADFSEVVPDA
jgi:hypothetical protein